MRHWHQLFRFEGRFTVLGGARYRVGGTRSGGVINCGSGGSAAATAALQPTTTKCTTSSNRSRLRTRCCLLPPPTGVANARTPVDLGKDPARMADAIVEWLNDDFWRVAGKNTQTWYRGPPTPQASIAHLISSSPVSAVVGAALVVLRSGCRGGCGTADHRRRDDRTLSPPLPTTQASTAHLLLRPPVTAAFGAAAGSASQGLQ